MEKPDLNQMWETYIKTGPRKSISIIEQHKNIQDTIRNKIGSIFPRLIEEGKIRWYHFLIHPYPNDPSNLYIHVRFSPKEVLNENELPEFCVSTTKIDPIHEIDGINKSLIKNEEIEEVWRIIGEQSEWVLNMIKIHNQEQIPLSQITQFMHFFMNMYGLGFQSKLGGPSGIPF